jgi:hypothetical protein
MEVGIPGADPANAMFAHQDGSPGIMQQVSREMRKLNATPSPPAPTSSVLAGGLALELGHDRVVHVESRFRMANHITDMVIWSKRKILQNHAFLSVTCQSP